MSEKQKRTPDPVAKPQSVSVKTLNCIGRNVRSCIQLSKISPEKGV